MFPTYMEVQRKMARVDDYTFYYKGHACQVWLDSRGMFHAQNGSNITYNGYELKNVLDRLYSEIRK